MTALAITGHRPEKLGGYKPNPLGRAVQRELRAKIEELRPAKLYQGMANGVDRWSGWISWQLRVPFVAVVPFNGQERKWPMEKQREYHELLSNAAEVVTLFDPPTSRKDAAEKLQKRNEWMVDHCDTLLAVWDGSDSGTGNCVRYAARVGRRIVRIDPTALEQ